MEFVLGPIGCGPNPSVVSVPQFHPFVACLVLCGPLHLCVAWGGLGLFLRPPIFRWFVLSMDLCLCCTFPLDLPEFPEELSYFYQLLLQIIPVMCCVVKVFCEAILDHSNDHFYVVICDRIVR